MQLRKQIIDPNLFVAFAAQPFFDYRCQHGGMQFRTMQTYGCHQCLRCQLQCRFWLWRQRYRRWQQRHVGKQASQVVCQRMTVVPQGLQILRCIRLLCAYPPHIGGHVFAQCTVTGQELRGSKTGISVQRMLAQYARAKPVNGEDRGQINFQYRLLQAPPQGCGRLALPIITRGLCV